MRVEGACASGGLALLAAEQAILSGQYKTVLVVGAEKMTDISAEQATAVLSGAACQHSECGSTFPGLYALLAQQHMQQYGTTREHLSAVSAKNHRHALNNPHAQYQKEITVQAVSESAMIAEPLRLLDCSPLSDGAAAVVLSSERVANDNPRITGFGQGNDSLSLAKRSSLTSFVATQRAAQQAYSLSGKQVQDFPVMEVHDCFTIAELLALEDLGVFAPGEAGSATLARETTYGGKVVVNPSGGLKACGHPVGATGVKQVAYLAQLLREGQYERALAHNVGGSGATAVVHILEAGEES
ncbi:thiolase domain-containing protein [Candidatus Woesebacteria bacterium]|nr:thiolase domain-containing protein [Candidatus Woesebacteria bacterium]MCD8546528.1 thiolase domain-containing protein [Candidatus Woesebacteria bacterium]